jgi:hypothetical protein
MRSRRMPGLGVSILFVGRNATPDEPLRGALGALERRLDPGPVEPLTGHMEDSSAAVASPAPPTSLGELRDEASPMRIASFLLNLAMSARIDRMLAMSLVASQRRTAPRLTEERASCCARRPVGLTLDR